MTARYWSAGITLEYSEALGWAASMSLMDRGESDTLMDAELRTRYWHDSPGALTAIVDRLIQEAQALDVLWLGPTLSVLGDGHDPEVALPLNWRELVDEQSRRLGWRSVYGLGEVA
jgi:hypothetical protein